MPAEKDSLREPKKRRLFVGVPLPIEVVRFAREVQERLEGLEGLRLAKPEQLHVTLAFIGHVGPDKLEAAAAVVREVPPELGGEALVAGLLPLPSKGRARVMALEIRDDGEVFGRLFDRVMTGLESEQVMRREKRPYRPHLTIGRFRKPRSVEPKSDWEPVRLPVESVNLYESQLHPKGARYSVLEHRELKV